MFAESDLSVTVTPSNISCSAATTFEKIDKDDNITFTVEKEENGRLPFLDVDVTRTDNAFVTGTYRKPTFSGVYSNYRSLIPTEYKYGLVTTLLYQSFEVVSDYVMLDKEMKDLKGILKNR